MIYLQLGRLRNRASSHCVDREPQRLRFEARQAANLHAQPDDLTDAVSPGLLLEETEEV